MQESLNDLWANWCKSEPEEGTTIIDRSFVPPVINALIFRFVSKKTIDIKDLGSALNAIWKPSALANLFAIGDGVFMAGFENAIDCNKVLARQPWQLSNSLMVFKKAVGNEKIADLVLNEVPFWVQIHDLEIQLLTRYVGELLGSKIGRVLEVDCATNSLAWGRCLRVRVLLNVTKSLTRGTKIDFNGTTSVVIFWYEKLCDFCFICGKLDHLDRDCPSLFANEVNVVRGKRQYEAWLRAEGMKGVSAEEIGRSALNLANQDMQTNMQEKGDKMEVNNGEEFALQVLNTGPSTINEQQSFQGTPEQLMQPTFNAGNPIGLDCMVRGMGPIIHRDQFLEGVSHMQEMNPGPFNFGPFVGTHMEPVYHLNPTQEWTNINLWNPIVSVLPFDASMITMPAEFHQIPTEQNMEMGAVQSNDMVGAHTQPSSKGKRTTKEVRSKRGKKQTGADKGKAKMTPTTTKVGPKGVWMKRSSGIVIEE